MRINDGRIEWEESYYGASYHRGSEALELEITGRREGPGKRKELKITMTADEARALAEFLWDTVTEMEG